MARGVIDRLVGFDGNGDPNRAIEPLDLNQLTAKDVASWTRELARLAHARPEQRQRSRELLAKGLTITSAEYETAANDLITILFHYVPHDSKPQAAEELNAYLTGNLTSSDVRNRH